MEVAKSLVQVEREVSRPLANFPTGNVQTVLSYSSCGSDADHKDREAYKEKLSSLKEKVKESFEASKANPIDNIKFIDILCRLGVSYHFENEVVEQLEKLFSSHDFLNIIRGDECDLYTVGVAFQVFRQFGFKLSPDVFDKFKDGDGKFQEHLRADVIGLLSLYEAAQWSTPGEVVLDEAVVFSTSSLQGLASGCSLHLEERIKNALKFSYHKGIPRIETRQYISYYEREEKHDETLLEFAKVDFNLLQLIHLEELTNISRWYKNLEIDCKIPYARNRTAEAYLWAATSYIDPKHLRARTTLATVIILVTILDDTYDAYGTLEELGLFTDALDRWLPNAPDALPDNMKYAYRIIVDFYEKLGNELEKEGRWGCCFHLKKTIKDLAKSYYQEAKWMNEDYVATFDEYSENGRVSTATYVLVAATYVAMPDICKLEAFEWLTSHPKLIVAAGKIWRLINDLSGYEFDHQRKHVGTAIDCYMKQYGVSKEEATKEIERIISELWKEINQELMRPHSVPYPLLVQILDFTRVCEVWYKYNEGFTDPEHIKDGVISLFAEKIHI